MHRLLRRHLVATGMILLAAVIACAVSVRAADDWLGWLRFDAAARLAVIVPAGGPTRGVGWAFTYRDAPVALHAQVPTLLLEQARALQTDRVFMSGPAVRAAYMATFVRAQEGTPLIADLAGQLRSVRLRYRLDDDEYLELIATAVQSLPYGGGSSHVRAPVETLADGEGVCTDKSILLAALLLHEGYDTGLWAFDTQRHVAVAVRSCCSGFAGSGYAFIETTRRAYVGDADGSLLISDPLTHTPQLVRVGGATVYTAEAESRFIVSVIERNKTTAGVLATLVPSSAGPGTPEWARYYAFRSEEHDRVTRLAVGLESHTDDRARTFEQLIRPGGR